MQTKEAEAPSVTCSQNRTQTERTASPLGSEGRSMATLCEGDGWTLKGGTGRSRFGIQVPAILAGSIGTATHRHRPWGSARGGKPVLYRTPERWDPKGAVVGVRRFCRLHLQEPRPDLGQGRGKGTILKYAKIPCLRSAFRGDCVSRAQPVTALSEPRRPRAAKSQAQPTPAALSPEGEKV